MNEEANRKLLEYFEVYKQEPRAYIDFFDPERGLTLLFKYAVPEVISKIAEDFPINKKRAWQILFSLWYQEICESPDNATVALANAILKWLESEKK